MTRPPTVTVITATYNSSATLRLTLASLFNQDFADFEVWVIGDHCTDESEAVVRAFGDKRLHWQNLETNHGSQAAPNNEGLRRARGEYIAYLGHDDLWLPSHLSGLVGCLTERRADFAHALCAMIAPDGVRACIGPPRDGVNYAWHFIPPSSWLHRRDLIETCGLWGDPNHMALGVDLEFSRRAYRLGKVFAFQPRLTVLKFPSQWFKAYARVGEPVQARYWQALQADPHALERDVLTEAARAFARAQALDGQTLGGSLRNTARIGLRRLRHANDEREPLATLLRWRARRQRRALRQKRGLPPTR